MKCKCCNRETTDLRFGFCFDCANGETIIAIEDAYYDGQSLNAKSVTSQMIIDNSISYYNEIYKGGEQ